MARKKNGFNFVITAWGEKDLEVYLPKLEAEALIFINKMTFGDEGEIHPYELANHLWPDKYIHYSNLDSQLYSRLEDGIADAMKIISKIRCAFKDYVEKESLFGIYDPFPFFIVDDPQSEFIAITISDGIKVIRYYPINKTPKE